MILIPNNGVEVLSIYLLSIDLKSIGPIIEKTRFSKSCCRYTRFLCYSNHLIFILPFDLEIFTVNIDQADFLELLSVMSSDRCLLHFKYAEFNESSLRREECQGCTQVKRKGPLPQLKLEKISKLC